MSKVNETTALYEDAVAELEAARADLAAAQKRAVEAETRVRLLEGLMALNTGTGGTILGHTERASGEDLIDATVEILKERGCAMGVREVRGELLARGVPLPGRGDDANLIAKFQRSGGRIVRVSRGLYDIPRDGLRPALGYPDGRIVALGSVTKLGRGDDCDIVLSDSKASRLHATIVFEDGAATIEDAGSANGTLLNGKKLKGTAFLAPGDRIQLGDTMLTYSLS